MAISRTILLDCIKVSDSGQRLSHEALNIPVELNPQNHPNGMCDEHTPATSLTRRPKPPSLEQFRFCLLSSSGHTGGTRMGSTGVLGSLTRSAPHRGSPPGIQPVGPHAVTEH